YKEVEQGRSSAIQSNPGSALLSDGGHCTVCGADYKPDAKYCPGCGAVIPREDKHHKCPDCNTEISWGTTFCPNCGKKLVK
ncbi:MAG: zinc-ribbon domain-containing protein, partial [Clostridia bacterium]|nr:zinc-ribbon domain-containing protein [Clostridia bacterium]